MAYKALYRTYRPDEFEQMSGQKHIIKTLENAIAKNKIAHAYLFCGPRGTGKTSTAKIFAKAINCNGEKTLCGICDNCLTAKEGSHPDIIEIDAASNNGVEEARNLIEKVKYAPILGKYKIYIIDEVHMMSTGAFNALLKTIEEPPAHVIFILATTEPHKVIPTILSRCQRFDFTKISRKEIVDKLQYVVDSEQMKVEDKVLENIAILADGGLRDALSILDQCRAYSPDLITVKDVNEIYGIVSVQEICELIELVKKADTKNMIQTIENFDRNGTDIKRLTNDITEILKESVIYDYAKEESMLQVLTLEEVRTLKLNVSTKKRLEMIDILMDTFERYRYSSNVVSYFEVGMLKIMNLIQEDSLATNNEEPIQQKDIEYPSKKVEIEKDANLTRNEPTQEEPLFELPEEDFIETIDQIVEEPEAVKEEIKLVEENENEQPQVNNEEVLNVSESQEQVLEENLDINETLEEKEDENKVKVLSIEYVLSLLVSANKPEKLNDIELMRKANNYLFDMKHGKYANLLKNKQLFASGEGFIVLNVDSDILAKEINDLDENEEFLQFTKELLNKKKKVFAISTSFADEVVKEFKERNTNNTLPQPIKFEFKEEVAEEKDDKLEKLNTYFGDIEIKED